MQEIDVKIPCPRKSKRRHDLEGRVRHTMPGLLRCVGSIRPGRGLRELTSLAALVALHAHSRVVQSTNRMS